MKKLIYSLVLFLFAVTSVGNTVLASAENNSSEDILTEIEEIANNSESVELIDADELPAGTPIVYFDTIEDFEKAVKELEQENKNKVDVYKETDYLSLSDKLITPMADYPSTTERLKVFVKPSLNPLKSTVQPVSITVDLNYSYSSGVFKKVNRVSSHSPGPISEWYQTDYNSSFYNWGKGVSLDLFGYHEVGMDIKGFLVGARVNDEISFNYAYGGSTNIPAK